MNKIGLNKSIMKWTLTIIIVIIIMPKIFECVLVGHLVGKNNSKKSDMTLLLGANYHFIFKFSKQL